jgi:ATPase subunit of ABC transporter with duplicated ATPase domains
MAKDEIIARFEDISFEYNANKPILKEVNFAIRRGLKITLMGQNGAGKSTLFGLLTGTLQPEEGVINIVRGVCVAISRQVIPRDQLDLTVREFFQKCFDKPVYDIDPKIDEILEVVHLVGPSSAKTSAGTHEKVHDRLMKSFSGGQQARLLLASALIQDPDLLLLDEPTNNLDHAGIEHLKDFIKSYKNTVMVISHDAEFLNSFTDGVLYLDVFSKKVEQYVGNYYDVVKQITARVEAENRKNALLQKEIQAKKEKANKFAFKGGQMRLVAKQMREKAEELEEEIVDVRREDKTIRAFQIPVQDDLIGPVITINNFTIMKNHKIVNKKASIVLKRNNHLQLKGPNGIGKSTLLETLAKGESEGVMIWGS